MLTRIGAVRAIAAIAMAWPVGAGVLADQPESGQTETQEQPGGGDRVSLVGGTTLVGAVRELNSEHLVMDLSFGAGIEIPRDQVLSITTSEPRAVVLDTGDRVVGTLVVRDGIQAIVGSRIGDVAVPLGEIVTVRPASDDPESPEAVREEMRERVAELEREHAEQVEQASAPPSLGDLWSYRVEMGLNGSQGNTERFAFRARGEARRETDSERLLIFAEGNFASENGNQTTNEVFGGIRGEIDVSERTFVFGRARFETDEFEDLTIRTTVTAGIGHFIVQRDRLEFKVRGGGGFQHESFDTGTSDTSGLVEAGYDFRADVLRDRARITHSLTYLPNVGNPIDEYRLEIDSGIEIPIGGVDSGWSLRGGIRNEYDNDPEPGIKKLDTSYFLNLVYLWD